MPPMHVVHVDDDSKFRTIFRVAFQISERGIKIHQFESGEEALPYITENAQTIDLFVLDIPQSEGMSGIELARKIRDLNCPGYIVLTADRGHPEDSVIARLRAHYYQKPWHLVSMVEKLLRFRLNPLSNIELIARRSDPLSPDAPSSGDVTLFRRPRAMPAAADIHIQPTGDTTFFQRPAGMVGLEPASARPPEKAPEKIVPPPPLYPRRTPEEIEADFASERPTLARAIGRIMPNNSTTPSPTQPMPPIAVEASKCPVCNAPRAAADTLCSYCGTIFDHDETSTRQYIHMQDVPRKWPKGQAELGSDQEVVVEVDRKQLSLPYCENILIGRTDEAQDDSHVLNLTPYGATEKGVSMKHLTITRKGNVVYAMDLDSTNGTWINGQRLVANQPRMLRNGDELHLGALTLRIHFQKRRTIELLA